MMLSPRMLAPAAFLIGLGLAVVQVSSIAASEVRPGASAAGQPAEARGRSRIVTIGGAVSEIVFALGHGDRVVGVDLTTSYPPETRKKANVGYMRALSAEGVIALAPTLILAIEGAGPPDVIANLQRAAIPFVIVPEGHDEESVLRKIRLIARTLGEEARGEEMAKDVAADFAELGTVRARIAERRRAIFVLAVGSGAPTVAGTKTSADGLLSLAGVENAMRTMEGFKPVVAESSLAAAPDVIVTMHERNHGMDADAMFALPAFAGTPAARQRRLVAIPSWYLSFGPRAPRAAHALATAIYPELDLPKLPERAWAAGRK